MNVTPSERLFMVGSTFTLYNFDESVMDSFVVKFHKIHVVPEQNYSDGSYTPERNEDMVSSNGNGWYCVGGPMRTITHPPK